MKIRNEKGDVVYAWPADKAFTQVFRTEGCGPGERDYVIPLPLESLPAGQCAADALLTTTPSETYTAPLDCERSHEPDGYCRLS